MVVPYDIISITVWSPIRCGPTPKKFSVSDIRSVCAGAYSTRTVAGYSSDLRIFVSWCASKSLTWLPAFPAALAEFINEQVESHCLSTIKRRLCAIAFAHRIRELPLPTEHGIVRLAVRRAARHRPSRPKQVRGLTQAIRAKIVTACSPTIAGLRDAALISIGYDTLCRSSELAAMNVEHMSFEGNGTAIVMIPRLKSDTFSTGRIAYLSSHTTSLLVRWLEKADLHDGPPVSRSSPSPSIRQTSGNFVDPPAYQASNLEGWLGSPDCQGIVRPLHAHRRRSGHDGRWL